MGADKPGRKKPPIRQAKPLDLHDERVLRAVDMSFAGRFTAAKIAEACKIAPRTYENWRRRPEFVEALAEKRADFNRSIERITFADKARRILALNDAALIALADLEERPKLKEVRPTKDGYITNEAFNNAAMAEFRAALDDIAKEKGERKNPTTGTDAANIRILIETDTATSATSATSATTVSSEHDDGNESA